MRGKLKNILKSKKYIYRVYAYLGSLIVLIIRFFVRTDDNLILFVAYGGKKYDDSPKAIYEYMFNSGKYMDYKCVWAFENPKDFNIRGAYKIKIDTLEYLFTLLRSKYWITNTTVKRGLDFTKEDVFYLNTWHGTPIKKVGNDVGENSKTFKSVGSNSDVDMMLVQSEYEANIFSKAFNINEDKLFLSGLPRNDQLSRSTKKDKLVARGKLGIDNNKTVILYAPTFREYDKDKNLNCYIAPPINFKMWENKLGKQYSILVRAHHEIGKIILNSATKDFVRDVSGYQNINELMIASDILISDYSSVFFDYSILERPMLCFAYDLDIYSKERGLYLNLDEEIPGGILRTENEVVNAILNMDYGSAIKEVKLFKNKYINEYGNASRKVVKEIFGL